jgi:1,2-phenylacetyl-CoA epoxidase catalytic subunit
MTPEELFPLYGSDIYRRLTEAERRRLNVEMTAWMVSQFLHGEQGALLATSQLVIAVDSLDSKLYGGSQVVDEARHVDVYNRYLHEKVGVVYGISPHLRKLLDMILLDSRWDMKFLGMQIMIEGLALAAFGMIRQTSYEPLLKEITRYVMADEARHVAYGVMSLRDFYAQQNEREIRERQDFVYEAAVMMRDRFLFQEVWEKCNMPAAECAQIALHNQGQIMFRQLLFAKIVPAIKRIGLLSDALRGRFQQLGILQYENWADPFADLERAERETPPSAPPLAVPT